MKCQIRFLKWRRHRPKRVWGKSELGTSSGDYYSKDSGITCKQSHITTSSQYSFGFSVEPYYSSHYKEAYVDRLVQAV